METHSIKPKRHRGTSKEVQDAPKRKRRTKKEMEEYRASLTKEFIKEGEDITKIKKVAHKPNLEAEQSILEVGIAVEDSRGSVRTTKISCIPKPKVEPKQVEQIEGRIVEGYVNVYKHAGQYWLGSDIHPTIEDARRVSGAIKARQIKVSFEGF